MFMQQSSKLGAGLYMLGLGACSTPNSDQKNIPIVEDKAWFSISLAQWSLHKMLQADKLTNLEFAAFTKKNFDIDAVEYVSQFFDKGTDKEYLKALNQQANDHGVKQLLIMIDGEGDLGNTDETERKKAVINHYKWVEAAKTLGCHSIRVNAFGEGSYEDVQAAAIDALGALGQYAQPFGINVIVENHGSYSSDGKWLSKIMQQVNLDNVGTLPDFGNFCIEREGGQRWSGDCINEYDRYKGTAEMMPFAMGISAKSHDFDAKGEEINTDYKKMLSIVKAADYKGYIGIEYEGEELDEVSGIQKTKALLQRYNV